MNSWETMRKDSAYSSVHDALDAGIVLLGKYYDMTDESPLAVLSTSKWQSFYSKSLLITLELVLDPASKDSYIKEFFASPYREIAMNNVRDIVSTLYIYSINSTEYSQYLEYSRLYNAKSATQERPASMSGPTANRTPAEAFGVSRHLAASQARHEQEVQATDPFAELNRYLDDPLEREGIDMLQFWKVSLTQYLSVLLMISCVG